MTPDCICGYRYQVSPTNWSTCGPYMVDLTCGNTPDYFVGDGKCIGFIWSFLDTMKRSILSHFGTQLATDGVTQFWRDEVIGDVKSVSNWLNLHTNQSIMIRSPLSKLEMFPNGFKYFTSSISTCCLHNHASDKGLKYLEFSEKLQIVTNVLPFKCFSPNGLTMNSTYTPSTWKLIASKKRSNTGKLKTIIHVSRVSHPLKNTLTMH